MSIDTGFIKSLAQTIDSFYVYDGKRIKENIDRMKASLPGVLFLYSVKTNPFPEITDLCTDNGFGIDAASRNEVKMGIDRGLGKDMIYYSAPGKTDRDIEFGLSRSIVIADSLGEVDRINAIAKKLGIRAEIGLRINPNFTMDDPEKGAGGKFGIDEDLFNEYAEHIKSLESILVIGIHVHSRSQELSSAVLSRYYGNMLALCRRVEDRLDTKLSFINMGGGLGIPFNASDSPLDIAGLGDEFAELLSGFKASLGSTRILIESGRYVCGDAGTYYTKVIDRKTSHGKTYLILSNTLNGFFRPSIARMVEGYTNGTPKPYEPVYIKPDASPISILNDSPVTETVTLAGNLCTSADLVKKDVTLNKCEVGDIISFGNAGCYSYVLTPVQFASQTPPSQIFVHEDGTLTER